jgi:GNAT superfamily N-acetyltransferase
MTQIYIDSWNQGFGYLLGRRNLTAERVDRMRIDIAQGSGDWSVAEVDGHVVGFISVGPSRDPIADDLGELESIAVDPPHWRQGIGRALMELALGQLALRWPRAILWTPAGYDRGHSFYLATGWRPLGISRADGTEVAFGHPT